MSTVRSVDGTPIAYEPAGAGPAVVLVDGGFGNRGFPSAVADLLAERFTAVRYDRRGRHDSGDAPDYAPAREVEDLAAVIGAVIGDGGGDVAVFGMSSGAVLALDAASAGVPMSRIAVYEPPFVVDDTRPPFPADYADTLARLVEAGDRAGAVELLLGEALGVPAEPLRRDPNWPAMLALAHTLVYDATLQRGLDRGTPLPRDRWSIDQPVLAIDGAASPAWARGAVAALAELLPTARRVSLPGQTHDVDARVLVPVLAGFFG
ncbi:MAG TPA: alpha/beta hydrolase [Actinophytocola sp.]|nr:alpha/beta hydrolase [Actinophytocola sp.]